MAQQTGPQVVEEVQLRSVTAALQRRFAGRVAEDTVAREVDEGLREFSGVPVRTFIPVLLQKRVTDRLRKRHPA